MKYERSLWCSILLGLALVAGASAQEESTKKPGHYAGQSLFRVSLGSFSPDGESRYWEDKEFDFTGSTSEFDDLTGSADYLYFVSARVGLMLSFGGWEGQQTQSYREFVDPVGGEIAHLTTIDEAWLDFGVVFHFVPHRSPLMPYVGAGGSVVSWSRRELGDFIFFDTLPPSIFSDTFRARGDSFGYFFLLGLEVPVSDWVSLFAEGRWRSAEDELGGDFAGFGTLDLSGSSIGGGVSDSF